MRRYLDDPDSARYRTAGERAQETEEEDEEEPEEDADAKRDAESPMTQQFLKTRTGGGIHPDGVRHVWNPDTGRISEPILNVA